MPSPAYEVLEDGNRYLVFRDDADNIIGQAAAHEFTPDPPVEDTDLTAILAVDPASATTEDVMFALQWLARKLR